MTREMVEDDQSVRRRSSFRVWAAWVLTLAAVAALVVRLTVRDHWPVLSAVYYGMPWALIGVVSLVASILWKKSGRRGRARLLAGCFLLSAGCWYWTTWFDRARATDDSTMRVVYWNTARRQGVEAMRDHVRGWDADVIGLGELELDRPVLREFLREGFPEYAASKRFKGMVLLTRGEIVEQWNQRLPSYGRFQRVRMRIRGRELTVVLVDLAGNPLLDRSRVLNELARHARRELDQPLIVLGDFNTPPDSVHFRALGQDLKLAQRQAGHGYAPTWPVPLPVLQIDHVWTNSKLVVARCFAGWSWHSDHRAVVADLSFTDEP